MDNISKTAFMSVPLSSVVVLASSALCKIIIIIIIYFRLQLKTVSL